MTVATAEKKSVESVSLNPEEVIQKPDDTMQIIKRLMGYMAGKDGRGKFIVALIFRVIALMGLSTLPYVTGQAINVVSEPDGTVAALQQWIVIALIAATIYLLFSFIADRFFSDLATKAEYKLQMHLFSHMQTL